MISNLERAKQVAMAGLVMTSCGFALWLHQGGVKAATTESVTTVTAPTDKTTPTTGVADNSEAPSAQPGAPTLTNSANSGTATTSSAVPQASAVNNQADQPTSPKDPLANDNRNLANQDQASLDANGNFKASGWHASGQAQNRPYHWMILVNQDGKELDRQNITNEAVNRPDVARAFPDLYHAAESGFNVHFNLANKMTGVTSVRLISRYSASADGNSNYVGYWFAPVTIDRRNYAYLDSAEVANGTLTVSGWNATNDSVNRPYHYLILFDKTTNREVTRLLVTNTSRSDVAKVLPGIAGAGQSGFRANFNANAINFNDSLQLISRYSSTKDGNSGYVDYWFNPLTTGQNTNQAYLDSFNLSNGKQLTVSGWHADDVSQFENQHYLILFDNTSHQQVAVQKATAQSRPDVAKAYPRVTTAGKSGFTTSFDLQGINLQAGHSYSVVSRYSTSANGNGGDGQYTDYWFNPVTLNQQAAYLDHVQMTDQGLQVSGWMASDQALSHSHPFIVVLNDGKPVASQALTLTSRPDVARVFPGLYNSEQSGFNTLVKLNLAQLTGTMQVVLRFSAATDGQTNNVDQPVLTSATNAGYFDQFSVSGKTVTVTGWHISDQSGSKPYQYLIYLNDQGKEIYRARVQNPSQRSDVAKAYPAVLNSGQSGFQLTVTLPDSVNGTVFQVINRLTDDPAGNGNYVDVFSNPLLRFNMNANAINRYILQHKIGHAAIQTNYVIPQNEDTMTPYSETGGTGKPDMVIVHETANPNDSLWGEINYMKDHYNVAFVHAFVDGNQIVEIAPTKYEAWGAAYPANGHAIQFEQVEVYGADNFVRELVNGAYYTAVRMKQYGIIPSMAWKNWQTGQYGGSLWSHHLVSQYIGHTDHTDPDGYWANRAGQYFGTSYTMNDFFELVKYEYLQL